MTRSQKFAIALIVITLLLVLRANNKSNSTPMEPRTSPAAEGSADISGAKNKIQGSDTVLSPSHNQDVIQGIKKECESPFYRASNPETCEKLK
jgi:hypothetical protein